jgi:hypothetical protein
LARNLAAIAALLGAATAAEAQAVQGAAGAASAASNPNLAANPLFNPLLNPYLNPLVAANPAYNPLVNPALNPAINPYLWNPRVLPTGTNRGNALLYYVAASQSLPSLPTAAGRSRASRQGPPVAEAGRMSVPGAGASRYFLRGTPGVGGPVPRYFQRHNRYFLNHER